MMKNITAKFGFLLRRNNRIYKEDKITCKVDITMEKSEFQDIF